VYSICIIILIVIVFDISEKLDDFIKNKAPLLVIVVNYYFNFIPFFINLFSPLFTFISVIFFTSKMASNTEIVAILSAGVSFKRFILPYLIAATFITLLTIFLLNFVIPKANFRRLEFEDKYIRNRYVYSHLNIHIQTQPNTFMYFESFNNQALVGYKFSIEKFKNNKLEYKLNSETAQWDTIKKTWKLSNYSIRKINGMNESLISGFQLDTLIDLDPIAEFKTRDNNIETMNYFELNNFIENQKKRGSDQISYYLLEKYQRFALPFSTYILTLIGVALASRKVRGGIGLHIGLGILLSFTYILFMQVSNTFACMVVFRPCLPFGYPILFF
jgi:lipopolysaccharide export system permease protein